MAETATIPVHALRLGSWRLDLSREPLSSPELRRRYDRAAPAWAQVLGRLGYGSAYRRLLSHALSLIAASGDAAPRRVLDAGTGTGALAEALNAVSRTPVRLDAVDLSPVMLDQAELRLARAGAAAVMREADVCALPYDASMFDLVMAAHLLEHLADPKAALTEMARTLRPGGWMVLCLTRRSPAGRLIQLRWRTRVMTDRDAARMLAEAGLTPIAALPSGSRAFTRRSLAWLAQKPHD